MAKNLFTLLYVFTGILFLASFSFLAPLAVLASSSVGAVSGYAWSDQIGWVNFGTAYGNVQVEDYVMTGYAWNENTGRINLNPATNSWGVRNNGNGNLSGYAWDEGTGKINFSGVTIDANGKFSGVATGDNNININFSCDKCNVQTDWRKGGSTVNNNNANNGSGGGSSWLPDQTQPVAPAVGFNILINGGSPYTNNLGVVLKMNADANVAKMAVSNSRQRNKYWIYCRRL